MGLFDFLKSNYNEIRPESEWEENGFYPEFERVSRFIVSKKKCSTLDLQTKCKLGYDSSKRIMKQLNEADIVDIFITNFVNDVGETISSKYEYKRIVKSHKQLDKILEDLETLKKKVTSRDKLDAERRKELGLDENWEPINTVNLDNPCYLYLMKDYNTGYYKIGISNSPEYREKTLQSEKPTIEMICNKKYVSRRIAHSIEQALHKTFADKRVRGEWFDLDSSDVKEIELTLK